LNASFVKWLEKQLKQNPNSYWGDGVQDYVKYAREAVAASAVAPPKLPATSAFTFNNKPEVKAAAPATATATGSSFDFTVAAPADATKAPAAGGFSFPGAAAKPAAPAAGASGFSFASAPSAAAPAKAPAAGGFSFAAAPAAPAAAAAPPAASAGAADGEENVLTDKPAEILKNDAASDEHCIYEVRTKLYKIKDGQWKDYGVGIVRLTRSKADATKDLMLVMRNSIGKIQLNCAVSKSMKFDKVAGKGSAVRFLGCNVSEGGEETGNFMMKVKPESLDKFHDSLEQMAK
jgi:hypothetical protein